MHFLDNAQLGLNMMAYFMGDDVRLGEITGCAET